MNTIYLLFTVCSMFYCEPEPKLSSHTALRYQPETYYQPTCRITMDDIIISKTISRNFKKGLREFTIQTQRQYVRIKRINKVTYSIADLDKNGHEIRRTLCALLGKLK